MLTKIILDNEKLYRAVPQNPIFWKKDFNKPSSAIFKDSKGVSVDRDGGRLESKIIQTLRQRFELKAILKLTAKQCRKIGTYPVSAPTDDNIYHAEIHSSENKIALSGSKAKKLRDIATLVCIYNDK